GPRRSPGGNAFFCFGRGTIGSVGTAAPSGNVEFCRGCRARGGPYEVRLRCRRTALKTSAGLAACALAALVMFASPSTSAASPFSDVPHNHWALDYIRALAADGIIQGYPQGKFDGSQDMTRYETAAI